jgi:hypothetical protein
MSTAVDLVVILSHVASERGSEAVHHAFTLGGYWYSFNSLCYTSDIYSSCVEPGSVAFLDTATLEDYLAMSNNNNNANANKDPRPALVVVIVSCEPVHPHCTFGLRLWIR